MSAGRRLGSRRDTVRMSRAAIHQDLTSLKGSVTAVVTSHFQYTQQCASPKGQKVRTST
jgi:hypothetical protein